MCAWPIWRCVGSHTINGVAELHSRLMREDVLKDLYEMWPEKFTSITNGVTRAAGWRWPTPG